jgi:hypothetical protein
VEIVDSSGARFELKVLGYQFPHITDEPWDANWLSIQVSVDSARGSWSASDPSLVTADVAEIADWLLAIADGGSAADRLDFLEPNLSFELLQAAEDRARLRVCSNWSCVPIGPREPGHRHAISP